MTQHLLTQTIPREVADLARYYTTGTTADGGDLRDLPPPPAPGHLRLYRGEGEHDPKRVADHDSGTTGRYFSTSLKDAQRYAEANEGRLYYVDLSPEDLARRDLQWFGTNLSIDSFNVTGAARHQIEEFLQTRHYVLPDDMRERMQPYEATARIERRDVAELAARVVEGSLTYSEALDELMYRDGRRGGDFGIETEERLGAKLADVASRNQDGVAEAAAQFRRDMHPLVAKGLGINPEVAPTPEQISALLAGRQANGEKIEGKHYSAYREYDDPKTGEKKEKIPLGSVDFTLSPDKSVSIAWAFGVPAEQAAIYQAHRDAAHETMAYLEAHIARAAKGKGGQDGWDSGHLGWISFDHYTARPTLWMPVEKDGQRTSEAAPVPVPGDPDLHTHFNVMNAVFCENGRVGSLDLDQLQGLIKEGGALYQAHLAQNLRDRLQASVSLDPETGMARLDAVPDHVRSHFSKRTQGGEEAARAYAKELGLDWDSLPPERRVGLLKAGVQGESAGLDGETRAKLKKDDMADFTDWHRQAEALGWRHTTIEAYGPPAPPLTPEQRHEKAYQTSLPWLEAEFERKAVLSMSDARTAALRGLIAHGIDKTVDVEAVTERMMRQGVRQNEQTTRLLWEETEEPRRARITTALHAHQERAFLHLARIAGQDRSGALARSDVRRAVRLSGLDFSGDHGRAQLEAIYRIGTGARLTAFVAAAGAGKTESMKPLVAEWTRQGRTIYGTALASRQSDDLADAGIPQRNIRPITVFLETAAKGEFALDRKSVVVVDEISLLGTRQGLELLRLQERHNFRMVWLGDDRQLASLESGQIIDLARRSLGEKQIPEVLSTRRQTDKREQKIVKLFRDGKAAEALTMKREDGTAELVPGGYRETVERVAALVKERLAANAGDGRYQLTVSSPTNADAHRLGVAIRQARRELGEVGPDLIRVNAVGQTGETYDMALAPGDKVRLFASTRVEGERGSIGRNGSVLTVLMVDEKGLTVRNAKGREGRIPWKALSDGQRRARLAYGEVMTTHTAQGSTATEHIYALPTGSRAVTGFSAYSSGTRHRRASYLVVSEGAEKAEVVSRRPVNDVRPLRSEDAWDNLARNFARQPKRDLAIDFLAQTAAIREGAVRALQDGMRPIEVKASRGEGTALHETFARKREAEALQPLVEGLERTVSRQRAVVERVKQIGPAVVQAVRQHVERYRGPERGRGPHIGL